jgi:beta-lactamase regulating signal transducer with metallopeptidase domain
MMADILNHLWQSTILATVVALLALAFRRNRARLRYGLWFVASAKFLVPFAALTAAGNLVEWTQAPAPVARVMTASVMRVVTAPFAELSTRSPLCRQRQEPIGSRRCSSPCGCVASP